MGRVSTEEALLPLFIELPRRGIFSETQSRHKKRAEVIKALALF
jgi:hypothetical protein